MIPEAFTEIGWRLGFFVPLIVIGSLLIIAALVWLIPLGLEKRDKARWEKRKEERETEQEREIEAANYDFFQYLPFQGRYWRSWDRTPSVFISSLAFIAALLISAVQAFAMIPYDSDYWKLYRVSGEVTNVSNVFADASGELSDKPVIQLDTVDRPISVDDPRAIYWEGENLTLTCTINWRYQAADRYSCELYEMN